MSATDASNANYVFKSKWLKLMESASRRHPTIGKIRKVKGLTSTTINTVEYGNDQGAAWGDNMATAQANVSQTQGMQFTIPVRNGYRVAQIKRVALELSRDKEGAYDSLVTRHIKAATNGIMDDVGFMLFRDGTGARGRRLGALVGNTVQLYSNDDARNFFRGMTCKGGVSTTSLRVGTAKVTNVDPDLGQVTFDNIAGIVGFLADDYLFREGETGNAAMDGFETINPLTSPSAGESFRGSGNDRTFYTALLAGARLSTTAAAGLSTEERALTVATKIFSLGGDSDTLILNPLKALEIVERLSGKISYDGDGKRAVFGFSDVGLKSAAGELQIVADPDCPIDRGRVTKLSDWVIEYAGKDFIHSAYASETGAGANQFFVWKDGSDVVEGRWSVIANLYAEEPRNHGVFPVA
jgi:hypothetical protein